MEDVLVRQDRVSRDAIEEHLQHPLSPRDHDSVFLGLSLLHGVIRDGLLRRQWGYDERRVELCQSVSQRFKLGIAPP